MDSSDAAILFIKSATFSFLILSAVTRNSVTPPAMDSMYGMLFNRKSRNFMRSFYTALIPRRNRNI